ncbi:MAG: DUF4339 domain-containing protein [Verrucomicrobiales bacterium]|nr:DUF4339 domain-containing protein [Verrucomicrobiales bacterium]
MEWFYANDDDEKFPVEESELERLISAGEIRADMLVWNQTMADWRPAGEVKPELFPGQLAVVSGPAGVAYQRVEPPGHGACLTSMICGICGLVFSLGCGGFGLPFSIAAVICGHMGRKQAVAGGLPANSNGMGTAGLVTGYIGIALGAIAIFIVIVYFAFIAAIIGGAAMEGTTSP